VAAADRAARPAASAVNMAAAGRAAVLTKKERPDVVGMTAVDAQPLPPAAPLGGSTVPTSGMEAAM